MSVQALAISTSMLRFLSAALISVAVLLSGIMAADPNSLFLKWRPKSRFIAPAGWLNDPNGAMYDPTRDTYHLFYQWHPNHVLWGNISWGHAVSRDLITWTDVQHQGPGPAWKDANALALGPTGNGTYNGLGIFSGTAQAVSIDGSINGTLLAMYTSVSYLPIDLNAYHPGAETQSLAYSNDGGQTWQDYADNPVIKHPPPGWDVKGWRDPFFGPWPELDAFLGQSEPHYYLVLAGGINNPSGPRISFYSAKASNLADWTFLGALWEPEDNVSFGNPMATGSWGTLFEVSAFFSLKDQDGKDHWYVQMGTNGGNKDFHRASTWSVYNEGALAKRDNGSVAFTPISGGSSDWGILYALTSFVDRKHNDRRVQWGWAPEDFPGDYALSQGFQGCFALPRELYAHVTKDLIDPDGKLNSSGAFITKQDNGKFTASVLGVKPLEDVVAGIREDATPKTYASGNYSSTTILETAASLHFELSATFPPTAKAGFIVAASPGKEEYTTIYYNPSDNTVNVDRSHTTTKFGLDSILGFFYPFTTSAGTEDINLRVFVDGSLLEVYVNDRFALTTRVYPDRSDSTGFGIFVGDGSAVAFKNVEAWHGGKNVWPERPLNSNSTLLTDTSAQTNNGAWWPGT